VVLIHLRLHLLQIRFRLRLLRLILLLPKVALLLVVVMAGRPLILLAEVIVSPMMTVPADKRASLICLLAPALHQILHPILLLPEVQQVQYVAEQIGHQQTMNVEGHALQMQTAMEDFIVGLLFPSVPVPLKQLPEIPMFSLKQLLFPARNSLPSRSDLLSEGVSCLW